MSTLTTVRLHNMLFYGYHGAFEEETSLGQRFQVDVEFQYNAEPAYQSDVLQNAISYEKVYRLIEEVFTSQNFKLLETLVFRMIQAVIEVFPVQEVCVRVRKPSVPIKGVLDFVEVEQSWQKEG